MTFAIVSIIFLCIIIYIVAKAGIFVGEILVNLFSGIFGDSLGAIIVIALVIAYFMFIF